MRRKQLILSATSSWLTRQAQLEPESSGDIQKLTNLYRFFFTKISKFENRNFQLIDDLDIGSGLTRKQTMKRRMEQLSRDPAHNELLHQKVSTYRTWPWTLFQIKYERQLKALTDDLAKVECLLTRLTDQSIIDFQLENPDIIPELGDLYDLKPISLNSSLYTMSSNSESFLLRPGSSSKFSENFQILMTFKKLLLNRRQHFFIMQFYQQLNHCEINYLTQKFWYFYSSFFAEFFISGGYDIKVEYSFPRAYHRNFC